MTDHKEGFQLDILAKDARVLQTLHHNLVVLQDYLDQIKLMSTIVSHYQIEGEPNGLQVRMMGELADHGGKLLKKTEATLDRCHSRIRKMVWEEELIKLRQEQDTEPTLCPDCSNLLQVTEDVKVIQLDGVRNSISNLPNTQNLVGSESSKYYLTKVRA